MDTVPASACLFCDNWEKNLNDPKQDARRLFLNDGKEVELYGTIVQFRRHFGRHMEQLALFALPMAAGDEMEDDSADSDSVDEQQREVTADGEESDDLDLRIGTARNLTQMTDAELREKLSVHWVWKCCACGVSRIARDSPRMCPEANCKHVRCSSCIEEEFSDSLTTGLSDEIFGKVDKVAAQKRQQIGGPITLGGPWWDEFSKALMKEGISRNVLRGKSVRPSLAFLNKY